MREIIDAIDANGLKDDTLFIFASDNGPEYRRPWRGSAGMWTGTSYTAMEGALRVPMIARWPGRVPAGRITNDIVHVVDLFPTLARVGGAEFPTDRPIDGNDQLEFMLGRTEKVGTRGLRLLHQDRTARG